MSGEHCHLIHLFLTPESLVWGQNGTNWSNLEGNDPNVVLVDFDSPGGVLWETNIPYIPLNPKKEVLYDNLCHLLTKLVKRPIYGGHFGRHLEYRVLPNST